MDPSRLLQELRGIVGTAQVLVDDDVRAPFDTDWTGRWSGSSLGVVRPGTVREVQDVLHCCARYQANVVPQGGNSGLVGGAVPGDDAIVLSTRRLDAVEELDPLTGQITVGAGATLGAMQHAARRAGWEVGVDLAARDTATIGGMVATNAGGIRVLRHGMMRRQVAGIEAVLADGSLLTDLRGLAKDNTGYDLTGLVCGSEGTLGVITRVRLQLVLPSARRVTAMIGLVDLAQGVRIVASLRGQLPSLEAAEYVSEAAMNIVCEHAGVSPPVTGDHGGYLLLECGASSDPTDAFAAALDGISGLGDSVAVATTAESRARLWGYREGISDAIGAIGIPHKLDVSVPLERLAAFERAVIAKVGVACPAAQVVNFGHVADGNLHINIVAGPSPDDVSLDDAVLELVAEHRGSVSAEHGIGRAKVKALPLTRSTEEITAMRSIKRALDPTWMLNPGVLFLEPSSDDVGGWRDREEDPAQ